LNVTLLQGFYLGDLLVEPVTGRVGGAASSAHLPPKAMEVLLCLASNPGDLVTRESLLERVWGPGQGSHEALAHTVRDIRRALGDDASEPRYIQTIPRRGYRLIQVPKLVTGTAGTDAPAPMPPAADPGGTGLLGDVSELVQDLKRRGVITTGIAYLVLGWGLIQVADIVVDRLVLPSWIATFVTVLVIAGFPIALILSWYLEVRDGRAVLDQRTSADHRRRRFTRTYLPVAGAMAVAAILVFLYDREFGLPESSEALPIPDQSRYLPSVLDNSIAVLRFMNLDGSDRTQVFSDGLADDVITALSRVPGLYVSSRGDAFTLEPNTGSARVRERLRVAYYLEGSVQIEQQTMRVIVQLIDSATGFHVLSRKFDRPLKDFFAIRDEITELTVANVRVALPQGVTALQMTDAGASDLDAYVSYRRGKEILERPRSLESIAEAITHFVQALRIDPQYAAAHAGVCDAHVARFELSNSEADIAEAERACARALGASPRLYVVHTALGELYRRTGRLDEAERAYRSALDMNANDVRAMNGLASIFALRQQHAAAEELLQKAVATQPGNWRTINGYGSYLFSHGRYGEAADAFRQVVALDPGNHQARTNLGAALTMAGDFEAGKDVYEQALEITEFRTAYSNLGVVYYYLGDFEKSVATHRKAVELAPEEPVKWLNLADALHFAGRLEEAREAFERARELADARIAVDPTDVDTIFTYAWASQMLGDKPATERALLRGLELAPDDPYGLYYAGLIAVNNGEREAALESLGAAIENGYPPRMLEAEPYLGDLRDDPAFEALTSASP
jgi:TolB-like protein/Flp pilus assembly protein TadD/DNA-binding winged helix-turn-helix (wHTH) protein